MSISIESAGRKSDIKYFHRLGEQLIHWDLKVNTGHLTEINISTWIHLTTKRKEKKENVILTRLILTKIHPAPLGYRMSYFYSTDRSHIQSIFLFSNLLFSSLLLPLLITKYFRDLNLENGIMHLINQPLNPRSHHSEQNLIQIAAIVPAGLPLLSQKITWTKRNHFVLPSGFLCETSVTVKC